MIQSILCVLYEHSPACSLSRARPPTAVREPGQWWVPQGTARITQLSLSVTQTSQGVIAPINSPKWHFLLEDVCTSNTGGSCQVALTPLVPLPAWCEGACSPSACSSKVAHVSDK